MRVSAKMRWRVGGFGRGVNAGVCIDLLGTLCLSIWRVPCETAAMMHLVTKCCQYMVARAEGIRGLTKRHGLSDDATTLCQNDNLEVLGLASIGRPHTIRATEATNFRSDALL